MSPTLLREESSLREPVVQELHMEGVESHFGHDKNNHLEVPSHCPSLKQDITRIIVFALIANSSQYFFPILCAH